MPTVFFLLLVAGLGCSERSGKGEENNAPADFRLFFDINGSRNAPDGPVMGIFLTPKEEFDFVIDEAKIGGIQGAQINLLEEPIVYRKGLMVSGRSDKVDLRTYPDKPGIMFWIYINEFPNPRFLDLEISHDSNENFSIRFDMVSWCFDQYGEDVGDLCAASLVHGLRRRNPLHRRH